MNQLLTSKESLHKQNAIPYRIPSDIFNALSPLDQLAARALEKCGKVLIIDTGGGDLHA